MRVHPDDENFSRFENLEKLATKYFAIAEERENSGDYSPEEIARFYDRAEEYKMAADNCMRYLQ